MSALEPGDAFRTIWSGEVEQVVDAGRTVRLHKEQLQLDGDVPLGLVRKYRLGGPDKPPVLLVHGFAQNRYSWHMSSRSLSAWLAEQGFDTWNLELRGHGRSRSDGQLGAEGFQEYVDDVISVLRALPDRAFCIGHSLGGTALYGAATEVAREPNIAMRGVIGIGAIFGFGNGNPFVGACCRITHALRGAPIMERLQIRTRLVGQLISRIHGVADVAGYSLPLSGWWPGSCEQAMLEERLIKGFDWTSVKVWQEMSRWSATGHFDYDAVWRETDVPVLVILGDKDSMLPIEDGRLAYDRSGSSDRTLQIFDDWSHEVHWGHLDLILGRHAPKHVWPYMRDWMVGRIGR